MTTIWGAGLAIGCNASVAGDPNVEFGDEQPDGTASLTIVKPAAQSVHIRDVLGRTGALVAAVEFRVETAGRVERIELATDAGEVLGDTGGDSILFAELERAGDVTVVARAFDGAGDLVASDSVTFTVDVPEVADCHEMLDLYGVEYTVGPFNQGVADPVTVTVPINGVSYRFWESQRRETFFMDCGLAVSLARAASHLRARDLLEVVDIGVYNYRCIASAGTPPNCTYGMSQHAYANGIDIGGFISGDGVYYSVEDDWVIDPDGEGTCATATEAGKDRFLHQLICELKAASVWNIVLTPNYNAAHRNHFHVDLTSGGDSIHHASGIPVDMGDDNH